MLRHSAALGAAARVLAAGALAATIALPAAAQDLTGTLKKIKDSGAITIGHRETSIPFSYLNDKQQPVGRARPTAGRAASRRAQRRSARLKLSSSPTSRATAS